jgi:hypothetical protein
MARFAKTFWKKVKTVTARVTRKVNGLGNFAPLPDDKPSPVRQAARAVAAVPRAIGAGVGLVAKVAASIVSGVGALASALISGLMHVAWGLVQTVGLALATPYYLTYSTEYAKANWSGFWNEFTFKELRDLLVQMMSDMVEDIDEEFGDKPLFEQTVIEIDIPDVEVALTPEVVPDDRPAAQQPKGRPTPKRTDHKIEPYPFRPAYAEAI